MWLVLTALRRPITIVVAVIGIALLSVLAFLRMPVDIFPRLDLPLIVVAQPYGGLDPGQMEGFIVSYYEYHFLYITGIEHLESKSVQNVALIKLFFHPGTDMSQALAQTVSYVDRSRAFMPPGTFPPFIVRFDAGSVPVGQLVFSSDQRSVSEIQDLALFRVRPLFATLPGVSAPPPYGGNQRTVVIRVDPNRLRSYGVSPADVVKVISAGNVILPAGNVRTGDLIRMTPINSVVTDIHRLLDLPIKTGAGPTVFLRDLGTVTDSSDIDTGYALVNGHRTVYIPVTKRADASTLSVINAVKGSLSKFRAALPPDVRISLEFDQSLYVKNALFSVLREGLLGAILTGLMVLLFLGDWRSAAIVVTTIPFALLTAVVLLWDTQQSINIMTLGGLALAVGILVDEATVTIENIHTHLNLEKKTARAVLDASREVIIPRLLAMLSILAVFVPSFFMVGVTRSLFVPLSLAVGFSMLASYFLSSSLVPVMAVWMLGGSDQQGHTRGARFDRVRGRYGAAIKQVLGARAAVIPAYLAMSGVLITIGALLLGREIFPRVDAGLFQLRVRAPVGTRVERTEAITREALEEIKRAAGGGNVEITLAFVGTQPPSYPVNTIYLWTSGQYEAVIQVAVKRDSGVKLETLEKELRRTLSQKFPGATFSFEAGDIVSQVMNFGSSTPVEIAISGHDLSADRGYAEKLLTEMKQIPSLRDLQFGQPLDYPTINIDVDRVRAGQLGVTVDQVGRSLVAATSSSRLVAPNYWKDPKSGNAYQVQVEIPQSAMTSIRDIQGVPVMVDGGQRPLVSDVADVGYGSMPGEYDRYNQQRMVTLVSNVSGEDLGRAAAEIDQALERAGPPPRGVNVDVRGQIVPMRETFSNLGVGVGLAIIAIFLLLAASFQSLRLAFVVISTTPAVVAGSALALLVTGTTLNLQSFMGGIMAIGVAVANAILLVTFAEEHRRGGEASSGEAAAEGARARLRPILMTAAAMIAGMIPMALALGEGAEQTAPLGRAVIGGLLVATFATLFILPTIYAAVQRNVSTRSGSLDPDDPHSMEFDGDRQ
jgi:multidrug efflux pump subunit AcrB